MDFWSRLIGGSRSLSAKTLRTTTPTERLAAFKRTCNTLQQIWRSTNSPSGNLSATTHARNCIERLNSVLSDESRGPAPHPCLSYASTSQIYVTVTKLALSYHDEDILRAAAVFFNTLIDAELDGVVDSRLFARALVDLVRRADTRVEEVETRLIELLFGVANNIRLQPDILPAWFAPRSDNPDNESPVDSGKEFAGATRKDDFPLFYLLIDYVHHEGRAGDFARTGLLYLIETASRSKILERWLIESDLATLMATGLGALYSQLGSLSFEKTEGKMPPIIALSDHDQQEIAVQPHLGRAMNSFLSYLLFWQDTIDHCKSEEVNGTLLDHFQILFLQQLLYPSLLESSDVEGGSTSAVLTYLYHILESIDQADLVHRILHFLLASPSELGSSKPALGMSVSRRKSLDVLAAFAEEAAKPSPSLFNLRDLALLGLQSTNRQTILATLRLLTVILQRHHSFTRSLIRTIPGLPPKQRTIGALNAELQQFLAMATSILDDPTVDDAYDKYLKDAAWVLEVRLCIPPSDGDTADYPMELRNSDPIVRELLNHLETFFTNSVVVNLALTEVLTSIASSHLVSLDGWLLVDQSKYHYPAHGAAASRPSRDFDTDSITSTPSMDVLEQIQQAYAEPTWSSADTPPLTAALQSLVQQIHKWRQEIPDYDVLVAARRTLLRQDESTAPTRSRQPSEAPSRNTSERPRPLLVQLESEMMGTASPRGRPTRPLENMDSPQRSAVGSPLRDASMRPSTSRGSSVSRTAAAEELRKRLAMPFEVNRPSRATDTIDEEPTSAPESPVQETAEPAVDDNTSKPATLGHVLTNVVILYEFLLELTATVQVRGNLFEEAGFPGVEESYDV